MSLAECNHTKVFISFLMIPKRVSMEAYAYISGCRTRPRPRLRLKGVETTKGWGVARGKDSFGIALRAVQPERWPFSGFNAMPSGLRPNRSQWGQTSRRRCVVGFYDAPKGQPARPVGPQARGVRPEAP